MEGTNLVADIVPGTGNSYPDVLTLYDGHLYFAANSPTGGNRLFRSTDGVTVELVVGAASNVICFHGLTCSGVIVGSRKPDPKPLADDGV